MKVIEINSEIQLTTDGKIPPGAIAIIYQGAENVFNKQFIKGIECIPYTTIISVYISLGAYLKGSKPQPPESIKDFTTRFTDIYVPVTDYENESSENNLINIAYDQLELVYPGKITILTI